MLRREEMGSVSRERNGPKIQYNPGTGNRKTYPIGIYEEWARLMGSNKFKQRSNKFKQRRLSVVTLHKLWGPGLGVWKSLVTKNLDKKAPAQPIKLTN